MRSCLFALVVLGISICGCSGRSPSSGEAAPSEARFTREDFEHYLKALSAHDYDGLTHYYTADVRLGASPDSPGLDREGIMKMEQGLADAWNWTMDVHQIVIDERGAAVRATLDGPFLKDVPEFMGSSPKAGERWKLDFAMFYVLRGGKIAELHPGEGQYFHRAQ